MNPLHPDPLAKVCGLGNEETPSGLDKPEHVPPTSTGACFATHADGNEETVITSTKIISLYDLQGVLMTSKVPVQQASLLVLDEFLPVFTRRRSTVESSGEPKTSPSR